MDQSSQTLYPGGGHFQATAILLYIRKLVKFDSERRPEEEFLPFNSLCDKLGGR
jgi:hypothetical protein